MSIPALALASWGWLRRYGSVVLVYLFAIWFTDAYFMADTPDYVDSIVAYASGSNYEFWEFGHLFWRPLGWLVLGLFRPLIGLVVGPDVRANATFALLALNWLAGILSALLLYGLVCRFCKRGWIATLAAVCFIFSQGVLNSSQTGTSHLPGLSLLLVVLHILTSPSENPERTLPKGFLAGLALTGSVCLWVNYLWAVPAALLSPLFLPGPDKARRRLVVQACVVFALSITLAYAVVIANLGIGDITSLQAWIASSTHGATHINGVTRMVFGFARSLSNMGDDGMVFKRFLVHDHFNPVSTADILRPSLGRFLLFYLLMGASVLNLLRSAQGKRIAGLFVLNAVPVIAFGILYDGGAIERYLPLYPLLFLSVSYSVSSERAPKSLRLIALLFVVATVVTNASALSKSALDHQQEKTVARIRELLPLLKPQSRVVLPHWQDDLVNFTRSFPFHPINQNDNLRLYSMVTLGTTQVPQWRQNFTTRALSVWKNGGDIWVSKRLLNSRPQPEWKWVEGDDRRVSWADLHAFFTQLEMGNAVGDEDGFVLLLASPKNEQLLSGFIQRNPT